MAPPRLERYAALAGAACTIALVALLVRVGRAREADDARHAPAARLGVPVTAAPLVVDGELDDPAWPGAARTGPFRAEGGALGKPYSEAMFLWDEQYLYLALYAADEHVEAAARAPDGPVWLDDDFHVVFELADREEAIDVSARGVVSDGVRRGGGSTDYRWSSHARAAVDVDGTLDREDDRDEEWVAEVAVPLAALDLGRTGGHVDVRIQRWDVAHGVRTTPGAARVRLELRR